MTRALVLRLGVALLILVVLVRELGAEPFLRAFDRITPASLLVALVLVATTTGLSAWRWSLVARRQGLDLPLRAAVPAYYRSQLLNQVLPGGVLGDVHRAVRHGSQTAAIGRAARAVVWERVLGQVGLVALTLGALLVLPSGIPHLATALPWLLAVALLVTVGVFIAAGRPWLPLLVSVLVAGGHLLVLLVALYVADVDVPARTAVPLLLVVLVASSIPTNIAGWGPREGAAAWVFGAAGLGAAAGVTVTTVYGILSLVATLPGAVVLALDALPMRSEVTLR